MDPRHTTSAPSSPLWLVGVKSRFDWLFTSASVSPILSKEARKEKEELIRATLAGNDEGIVDLWRLRELALSPGGLLTPLLRKQAWPKLTGCHEQLLEVASSSGPVASLVLPSSADMRALERDVSKTIWSIEDQLTAFREQQKIHDEKMQHYLDPQKQRSTRVRFAPHTRDISSPSSPPAISRIDSSDSQSPPETAETMASLIELVKSSSGVDVSPSNSPPAISRIDSSDSQSRHELPETVEAFTPVIKLVESSSGVQTEDYDSVMSIDDANSGSLEGYCPSDTTNTTSFTLSSRVVRWRKVTTAEQTILYNVILSLLRTEAEPSLYFEDDRYHYFSGLQDLTALLMINLDSPSLSSLILAKVAGSHLRDALRKDPVIIDTALSHSFMPLLEAVDKKLYKHLMRHRVTLPNFCRQWITCWFAQDVPDVEVASRLLDAFLAGHPLLPLYTSVALLTSVRDQILSCDSHLSTLSALLRSLPVQILFEEEHRMEKAESILSTAIQYMKEIPPRALLDFMSMSTGNPLNGIAVFQAPPDWSVTPHAPSDFALLKRARELRSNSSKLVEEEKEQSKPQKSTFPCSSPDAPLVYPLAFAAIGLTFTANKKSNRSTLIFLVFCVLTCFVVAANRFVSISNKSFDAPSLAVVHPKLSAVAPVLQKKKITKQVKQTDAMKNKSIFTLLLAPPPPLHLATMEGSPSLPSHPVASTGSVFFSDSNQSTYKQIVTLLLAPSPMLLPPISALEFSLSPSYSSSYHKSAAPLRLPSHPAANSAHPAWLLGLRHVIEDAVKFTHI